MEEWCDEGTTLVKKRRTVYAEMNCSIVKCVSAALKKKEKNKQNEKKSSIVSLTLDAALRARAFLAIRQELCAAFRRKNIVVSFHVLYLSYTRLTGVSATREISGIVNFSTNAKSRVVRDMKRSVSPLFAILIAKTTIETTRPYT